MERGEWARFAFRCFVFWFRFLARHWEREFPLLCSYYWPALHLLLYLVERAELENSFLLLARYSGVVAVLGSTW